KRLAGQAAKRYLLHVGDSFELGELAQKFPLTEAFVRFDVPGEVQPIDANRVDRSAREDQSHSRQASHRNEAFAYPRPFTPTKRTKKVPARTILKKASRRGLTVNSPEPFIPCGESKWTERSDLIPP